MANIFQSHSPHSLTDILGQPHVVSRLRQWLAKPRPLSLIFAGSTGVGKSATARIVARELGCELELANE